MTVLLTAGPLHVLQRAAHPDFNWCSQIGPPYFPVSTLDYVAVFVFTDSSIRGPSALPLLPSSSRGYHAGRLNIGSLFPLTYVLGAHLVLL
jgi:hypothetical protein